MRSVTLPALGFHAVYLHMVDFDLVAFHKRTDPISQGCSLRIQASSTSIQMSNDRAICSLNRSSIRHL